MTQETNRTVNEDLLTQVRAEMARRGISQGLAAKEIGISAAAFTQLLNNKYGASPENALEKMERWLTAAAEAQAGPALPVAPLWVPTPTAERVLAAHVYAQMAGDITVIYGSAGVGKTTASREYSRRYSSVWIATMTPATSSVAGCLDRVCSAVGIKSPPASAARMQQEIVRRIQQTGGLLIIDEANHLGVPALDELRSLHDETGIGLALVGNESLYVNMKSGNRALPLDRLYSRIGKRTKLAHATKADVQALAVALGIPADDSQSQKLLADIGGRAGALRSVVKTVRLATMMAKGASPTATDLASAWKSLSA